MAPYVPEEVDVFAVPHSRMKELVNSYFELIQSTNFSNTVDVELLLESLYHTFSEFKSHEQIENKLIVRKLRSKMRVNSVHSKAVCNCHKGSRLSEMMTLLEDGFNKITVQDRINYGIKLRKELLDFTNESFLPHMKEEEELFQPLLLKYFSYEELRSLKEQVIQKHFAKKEALKKQLEKSTWADCETEEAGSEATSASSESDEEHKTCLKQTEQHQHQHVHVKLTILDLPPELILKVFEWLTPKELCRCAQLCRRLNQLALDHALWKNMLPVQWSRGNFSFSESYCGDSSGDGWEKDDCPVDEDADIDESEDDPSKESGDDAQVLSESNVIDTIMTYLLPKVGLAVEKVVLANGREITDQMVKKFLFLCPNVKHIDLAYTNVTDAALLCFGRSGFGSNLTTLILSGCPRITDVSLARLAACLSRTDLIGNVVVDCEDIALDCWLLCDQLCDRLCDRYLTIGQRRNGVCRGMSSACSSNQNAVQNRLALLGGGCPIALKQQCSVNVSKNRLNKIVGVCGEPEEANSHSVDSCEPYDTLYGGMNCLRQSGSRSSRVCNGRRIPEQTNGRSKNQKGRDLALEFLDLSGCSRITDSGLSGLFQSGHFPALRHLDLSGCMQITSAGLRTAVLASPSLQPSYLFYCDNIIDGPYSDEANGCRNLECSRRACCRTGK